MSLFGPRTLNIINAITGLNATMWSLSQSVFLDLFIYHIAPEGAKNTSVGITASVSAVVSILVCFPIAWLVTKSKNKACIAQVTGVIGLVACIVSTIGISKEDITLMRVALIPWGIYWELGSSILFVIVAECVSDKSESDRLNQYVQLQVIRNSFYILGPLLFIIIMSVDVNEDVMTHLLRLPLLLGNVVVAPTTCLLTFFITQREIHPLDIAYRECLLMEAEEEQRMLDENAGDQVIQLESNRKYRIIPWLISAATIICSLFEGIGIKFLPLFILEEYTATNEFIAYLTFMEATLQALFSYLVYYITMCLRGKARTSFIIFGLSVVFLFVMYFIHPCHELLIVQSVFYLLRSTTANMTISIEQTLVTEHTEPDERGWWCAVNTLATFGSQGTCFIGGKMADYFNSYRPGILCTAIAYAVGFLTYAPILWYAR